MSGGLVVVSGRRLIAESVAAVVEEAGLCSSSVVVTTLHELATKVVRPGLFGVMFDLDRLALPPGDRAAAGGLTEGCRRIGFYDTFTPVHAGLAFELAVVELFPLTLPTERIVAMLEGRRKVSLVRSAEQATPEQRERLTRLSERELEVLKRLAAGRSVADVARSLGITEHTVQTHRRRMLAKLELHQLTQAVSVALSAGIAPETM